MMDQRRSIETTADDVDSAIAAGLKELGAKPGDVLVEVLEEPSRGIFGIGSRPARVRLQLIRIEEPPPPPAPPPAPVSEPEETRRPAPVYQEFEDEDDYVAASEAFVTTDIPLVAEEDLDEEVRIGREVLTQLLRRMDVQVDIVVRRSAPTATMEDPPWMLDITGDNMRLLIGRRGETINALQYVTRLIVSNRMDRRANILVDAGQYKAKRSERLRQLAVRMADEAVEQKRVVTLEPMPANERRIIHITLRHRPDVTTRSVGEGEARKVTIVPKAEPSDD